MKSFSHKSLNIITLGQCGIDFLGEQTGSSLKDMLSFKKYVGGQSAKIAIGCARLGLNTAFISTIGKDEMGQFIFETLQHEKINTDFLKTLETPTALYFRNLTGSNCKTHLTYKEKDRDLTLEEADIDPNFIATSQALYVDASLFIHELSSHAARKAIIAASANQTKVILGLEEATLIQGKGEPFLKALQTIFPLCDLIIGTEAGFESATGILDPYFALKQIRTHSNAILLLKRMDECLIYQAENNSHYQGFKIANTLNLNATEAFICGFLYGWLKDNSFEKCSNFAFGCATIVQSRCDSSHDLPSEKELKLYLSDQNQLLGQTSKSIHFSHIHYASTRHIQQEQLYFFNFGNHSQWLKLKEPYALEETTILRAKQLVGAGLKNMADNNPLTSIVIDDQFQNEIIDLSSHYQWLARSVELPGEVPLQFKTDPDISQTLLQWPKHHIVKVSVIYHPDDRYLLRQQQEATLNLLYRAARASEHELLIEIVPPATSLLTTSTFSHIIHRFYEIGIYPDWWQIMAPRDQRSWDSIMRVVEENDPHCRGLLVASPQPTFEQLGAMFKLAAKQRWCKGFVIGCNLFQPDLEQWFMQKITDEALKEKVVDNFQTAISLWNECRTIQPMKIEAQAS